MVRPRRRPEPQTFASFDSAGGQNVSAFIVNTYLANTFARVDITKEVDGVVPVGAIFQFHVQCGAYGADAVLVGEGTVSVPVPTAGPPQGAGGCTPVVTEPVHAAHADVHDVQPAGAVALPG